MNNFEQQLIDLYKFILKNGEVRSDRTGTGTISTFGHTLHIDISKRFPATTTKKLPFKAMTTELFWFLNGSSDERELCEMVHGTRDESKTTIWTGNAQNPGNYDPEFKGDLGRIYGVQWRSWENKEIISCIDNFESLDGSCTVFTGAKVKVNRIDQVKRLIDTLKNNPTDRRMILSAWNVADLEQMALPPCHMMAQFYLTNDKVLNCQMYQRSVDAFLGLPFNIASYALLVYLLAKEIGAMPGFLRMCLGDCHIYNDHIEQVNLQISREIYESPKLIINGEGSIYNQVTYNFNQLELVDYKYHDAIKAKMSV